MSEEQKQITVYDFIDRAEPKFANAPLGMHFEQEKSYAIQLLANNEYLKTVAEGNPLSLLLAMSNVANIGLSLNPAKKQAYLIPRNFKNKKGNYEASIFLEPSYMGLCDVATGTGCVEWVQAEIVRQSDTFELNGINQEPTHKRDPFSDRGEFVGAYCVAKLKSGDFLTTTMNAEDINKIRDKSETWKSALKWPNNEGKGGGVWLDFADEMRKKAVVRNAFKMWPKNKEFSQMSQAVHISNENEGFEQINSIPEAHQATPDQIAFFTQLINSEDAIGMFCFMTALGDGVQSALYNSFEKGKKTANKQLVSNLIKNGSAQIRDCQEQIEESAQNDDDLGVKEILENLSYEAIIYISDKVNDDTRKFIQHCLSELNA